ncbi:hypothetical protein F4604DRAFT_1682511 [Suillus subluteus]|nr:hypothetical protein F4604DRAFT_1682511 [Suillus subluteus]
MIQLNPSFRMPVFQCQFYQQWFWIGLLQHRYIKSTSPPELQEWSPSPSLIADSAVLETVLDQSWPVHYIKLSDQASSRLPRNFAITSLSNYISFPSTNYTFFIILFLAHHLPHRLSNVLSK